MKIVLYMAQTLNGYIAGVNDEAPWSDELWNAYYKYIKVTGNLIVGRKTYEIMLTYGNEFEKLGNPFTVVVTSQTKFKSIEKTRFVKSIKTALQEIEDMGFDRAIIGEGAELNKSALEENVIDEIEIDIEPMIFGQGIPLFKSIDKQLNLQLLETTKPNKNTLHIRYKVLK